MKPHPRIRKTIKWGGAAVTVLLVVVWIGSGWGEILWQSARGGQAGIGSGRAFIIVGGYARFTPLGPGDQLMKRANKVYTLYWGFNLDRSSSILIAAVPLWPVALVTLGMTGVAWRLDTLARRRARLNLCPKCNYDRTGLAPGVVCPECGSKPT